MISLFTLKMSFKFISIFLIIKLLLILIINYYNKIMLFLKYYFLNYEFNSRNEKERYSESCIRYYIYYLLKFNEDIFLKL